MTVELELTDQWKEKLSKLVRASTIMVFIKGTPDYPRCKYSRELIDLLNEENVTFGSFDILASEAVRSLLKKFSDWPTYPQVYVNGELLGGLDIIKEMKANGSLASALPKAEDLNTRLAKLVRQAPVMVFIKGSPQVPRCGFSKQIVDLLKQEEISFDSFDILQDDQVRQGLKEFSDWPTFPQLYVNGELIGGLDIVKEMVQSGELQASLRESRA